MAFYSFAINFLAMKSSSRLGVFGPELEHHTFGKTLKDEGYPEVLVIEQFESDRAKTTTNIWHHDVTGRKTRISCQYFKPLSSVWCRHYVVQRQRGL